MVVTRSIDVGSASRQQARPAITPVDVNPRVEKAAPAEPPKPNSVRPQAPPPAASPTASGEENAASIADTFERLLSAEDVDDGFANILRAPTTAADAPPSQFGPGDLSAEVRNLFAQLAANHMRQVRDFLIDLRWTEATIDWIAICQPALRSLRRAAEKLELDRSVRRARSVREKS